MKELIKLLTGLEIMQKNNLKTYIVIPAFNEEKIIVSVVNEIISAGYKNIIVIDDGSADKTYQEANSVPEVIAVRHKINRGYGAAVKTGLEAAKRLNADIVVTFDGDGQHDPKNIDALIEPVLKEDYDAVLGSRLLNRPEGMPFYKIIANNFGNFFTWILFGRWVTDSQSGLRSYSGKILHLLNTKSEKYEYASEVIREIHNHKLKFKEVPITVRYTEYSMNKAHKQSFINGLKTLYKMIWNLIT